MNYIHTFIHRLGSALVVSVSFLALVMLGYSAHRLAEDTSRAQMHVPSAAYVADLLREARKNILVTYNIRAAEMYYKKALARDPLNEEVLYELARVYLVQDKYAEGMQLVARFSAAYPTKPRIHYIGGLLAGYMNDATQSEALFKKYIASEPAASWQSRLDLSWALFKQGKYSEMEALLLEQIKQRPTNAWLLNNLGVSLLAQGEAVRARSALSDSAEAVGALSPETWQKNYSFNNPADTTDTMALLAATIAYNTARAQSKVAAKLPVNYTRIGALSPGGADFGIAVSACGESCGPALCTSQPNSCGSVTSSTINTCTTSCNTAPPPNPAGYGQSCSSANVCGVTGTGTIGCSGQCAVSTGLPATFGTACTVATACGAAPGRINCNGQCNVSRLNTCPGVLIIGDNSDEELDAFGNPVPRFGCAAAKVKIKALPLLVRKGRPSAIQWIANEAVSCTVTGGGQTWTGLHGVQITNPVQETTKYTVTCQPMAQCTGNGALPFSANVEVKVVPDWQEI
jgi:tetratricopeptide (TPR) repeat protein